MTTMTHDEMHRDHLRWLSENDLWRDNLRVWQAELQHALDLVGDLQKLFGIHQHRLQLHGASVRAHEQAPRYHEHELAEFERGETNDRLIALATGHHSEALEREEQRAAHRALNRDHYLILAHWTALLTALRASAVHVPERPPEPAKPTPPSIEC